MRVFSAILACLLFQLAQLAPVFGSVVDCAQAKPQAAGCACCDGLDVCPCASPDDPSPTQQPLPSQAGESLKLPVPGLTDARIAASPPDADAPAGARAATALPEWRGFYQGVSIQTAFCSFVI